MKNARIYGLSLFFTLCSVFIAGCGFQLKGTAVQLSERFNNTYLESSQTTSNDSRLIQRLDRLIRVNGGNVVEKASATVAIRVSPIQETSRQIALSSDATLKEYERLYSTTVTITDISSGIQLGQRTLTTTRYIQLDDRKVLAGEEQSEITKNKAAQDLAERVLLYLRSF